MDTSRPIPHEAAADVHKALVKEAARDSYSSAAYGTAKIPGPQSDRTIRPYTEAICKLKEPGGFRRQFLNAQADEAGIPFEDRPEAWDKTFIQKLRPLIGMGHFNSVLGISLDPDTGADTHPQEGTSGACATMLALFKCYVGTGIMMIPCGFSHGGIIFCILVLFTLAWINMVCTKNLVECRVKTGCSGYGDIASLAMGRKGRFMVSVSLVLIQFATVIAYMIFVSHLAHDVWSLSRTSAICISFVILLPICMLKDMSHLELPNLFANLCLLFGLGVMIVHFFHHISYVGVGDKVSFFEPGKSGIFIGMAIFSFEGTPMILPIRNAMDEPAGFLPIFNVVFALVVLLFAVFATVAYLCYGSEIETVALLNLPHSGISSWVRVAYMLALLFGTPLMFLPAARISERWALGVVKKAKHAWSVYSIRTLELIVFAIIAILCSDMFQRFIAVAGALCATPIMIIYPALFHLMLCAETFWQQAMDVFLMVIGFAAMVFAFVKSVTDQ